MTKITSIEQLSELYKKPSNRASNKSIDNIDEYTRTMLENSPFIIISTMDKHGFTDISPRGGQPGFIKVIDDRTLLIPDSAGNNRLDSFKNILEHPKIGIMVMTPGIDEVVRIKGHVSLHTDEQLLSLCPDGTKKSRLVLKVTIEDMFFHCAKAIMRAKLWNGDYKVDRTILPSLAQIMKQQQSLQEDAIGQEEMVAYYNKTL